MNVTPIELVAPFVKNRHFEEIFGEVNDTLLDLEKRLIASFDQPNYPIILICGPPRSGSTLLMQLIIACFQVGYVNNLMARFWKTPYIGTLLAQELRLRQSPSNPNFTSEFGATYGYDGPHEFGFFWQHWFPYNETHQTSLEDLQKLDRVQLQKELAAIESVFNTPLAFKNGIVLSLNMEILAEIFPKAIFIICKREPIYIAQSILQARQESRGSKEEWLSVKPQEYTWLKDRPYPEQIAGQIYYTEQRIQKASTSIAQNRVLTIDYSNLCSNPIEEMNRIAALVAEMGYQLKPTGFQPTPFDKKDVQRISNTEFQQLQQACNMYWKL